jgi:hypothetical protein
LFHVCGDGALRLSFGVNNQAEQGAMAYANTEWILFDAELSIGKSESAALVIAECAAEIAADISMRNNSPWVTPRAGQTVLLDDAKFSQGLPLVCGSVLTVGGARWTIEELTPPAERSSALAASA